MPCLGGSRSCWARRHRPGWLTARQYWMFIATMLQSKFTINVRKIVVIYTVPFSLWSYGKLARMREGLYVSRWTFKAQRGQEFDLKWTASTHPRTLKFHGNFPVTCCLKWQQKATPGILAEETSEKKQKRTLPDTFKRSFCTTNVGHHQGKSQPLSMEVRVHSDSDADAVESDQRSPHLNAENSIRSCVSDEVSNASNGESNWAFFLCVFYLLWVEMLFCCVCLERYGDVLTGSIAWTISSPLYIYYIMYIYIYTWNPNDPWALFWLESRPCSRRLTFKNWGQTGSR